MLQDPFYIQNIKWVGSAALYTLQLSHPINFVYTSFRLGSKSAIEYEIIQPGLLFRSCNATVGSNGLSQYVGGVVPDLPLVIQPASNQLKKGCEAKSPSIFHEYKQFQMVTNAISGLMILILKFSSSSFISCLYTSRYSQTISNRKLLFLLFHSSKPRSQIQALNASIVRRRADVEKSSLFDL